MELEKVSVEIAEDVVKHRAAKKKVLKMVEDFWVSDDKVAKVKFSEVEYANVHSAQSSFSKAILRLHISVFATVRKGELYLVKEEI